MGLYSVLQRCVCITMQCVKMCHFEWCWCVLVNVPVWCVICTCGVHVFTCETVRVGVECNFTHWWACVQAVGLQPPTILFYISVIIIHVQLMAMPSLSNLFTNNLALLADWSCAHPISASPSRWRSHCDLNWCLPSSDPPAWEQHCIRAEGGTVF